VPFVDTPTLRIAYEIGGPADGPPVLLLHGWPDDPRTYDKIVPALQAAGFRTIAPFLRGFGATTFQPGQIMRSGEMVAMAQDALDLADGLDLEDFVVVGHDWGARIAYALAILVPERVTKICAMSVGWQPGGLPTPHFEQARKYWYQWFMSTERGAQAVAKDCKGFARVMWETWAPQGWFGENEFATTAKSFDNPDWPDVTVHSYRVRWEEAEKDPRYATLDAQVHEAQSISVPTLMIQGGADGVTLAETTAGKGPYFTGGYARHVLDGVGHFPTREAPERVNKLLLEFLQK
jgi:pimeloyl-ACP methyl ester carboxylesterase